MTRFLASKDLRARLLSLRGYLPIAVFAGVLIYQIFSLFFLRDVSELLHIAADLVAYGLVGPIAVWFTINWIVERVEEREVALAAKTQAEKEQQRAIEKAREQERVLAAICSNSADA
ncbi:MAG: hypothetical protein KGJ80_12505, partial [Chloroflexota bacterium]|nr:hypothetical protein [Chloroflexota bacterium]